MSNTSPGTLYPSEFASESKNLWVVKRNGSSVSFDAERIRLAITKAFRAELLLGADQALPEEIQKVVNGITSSVISSIPTLTKDEPIPIEKIQDLVEKELMQEGYHQVARGYILYREERKRARAFKEIPATASEQVRPTLHVTYPDGTKSPLNTQKILSKIEHACADFKEVCDPQELIEEMLKHLYDGVLLKELNESAIFSARSKIEKEPAYNYVAARLLLQDIYNEVFEQECPPSQVADLHVSQFEKYIRKGVMDKRLTPELFGYDLKKLAQNLDSSRDKLFTYIGVQTLYDRYLIHVKNERIETPQYFWMRVAMGLALKEKENREERVIEFYNVLSQFHFISSTPTLFNSGSLHPQLSSCYLSTIQDDLVNIFKVIADNASLSKWSGGIGNDWTNIRATGAPIYGTNGLTQGVVPFLKVANDTAVAVNQGGKRKGAVCAYLETWHLDIEDFVELRKNTGDERRRTHDMNTANWIPDLFMKRVKEQGVWTLFNPSDTPDLHDLYGSEFEKRYCEYERLAQEGKLKLFKVIPAMDLWRKMITMLFETGHPWMTFKDPSNIRSPQSHTGVVHSSNLCTEILLNTSEHETAVCNLGSINLAAHIKGDFLDEEFLAKTIRTAMRMLDNVIDINYYPTKEARESNLRHRPVGLGLMGFQDALYRFRIPYGSQKAVEFADASMELISYYAILASAELAKERGVYSSYRGSKWSQGILPIDSIELLENERKGYLEMDRASKKDWSVVRKEIQKHGMRNCNTMAIAPTATIAHISGLSQSIEPTFSLLYVKSNLSGEFAVLNEWLVKDLKERGLWNQDMLDELKYYDGSVQEIEQFPEDLKGLYKTAFEIEPKWLIECASRRQKWIDMGQSLNLYVNAPDGRKLSDMYLLAWEKGLKTTYYLRSKAATQVEKSTLDINKKGIQPRWMKSRSASGSIQVERNSSIPKSCSLSGDECESCQ
ncbi:ribonucleoside-diphosphate reductase subunit alpha [Parachlamydia sp. AcF125]|uniref:ribonucleoside-diphosphate reductase subunit alpha n=1 Tax=Parachlamydia sp. AcF125 TaxID=2795736 RepID=UPI001BC95D9C|nr:ribonucleoside-diphosphate reductase subunit alpha [Parachlamydia sp. AcF125]MBS4167779.1 Ribonucleoside-diphosphate reductase 1 subunit alpha [Parachlamydia sp. AcF125]